MKLLWVFELLKTGDIFALLGSTVLVIAMIQDQVVSRATLFTFYQVLERSMDVHRHRVAFTPIYKLWRVETANWNKIPGEIVGQTTENAHSLSQNPTLSKIKQKKLERDYVNYGQDT
jgi:hypothetical protein